MRYIDGRSESTAGRSKGELSGNTANYGVTRVDVRRRPGNKRRLCYRKWLMLFSLKFQRDNRQNALAVDPAKGKTG